MPIHFAPAHNDRNIATANSNLQALLKELPPAQQLLLDHYGVTFAYTVNGRESGSVDFETKTIALNLQDFAQFTYFRRLLPSHNQRWALSTVKEEVIHYLAWQKDFDNSRTWRNAAQKDLAHPNKLRKSLMDAQRAYDSSDDEKKTTLEEYSATSGTPLSLVEKFTALWHGHSEQTDEYLVDLLLVRDHLRAKGKSQDVIDQKMGEAFPNTYALATEFEAGLEREAQNLSQEHNASPKLQLIKIHKSWDNQSISR